MIDPVHLLAVMMALGGAFAGACHHLCIRIGTTNGRVFDGVIIVLFVNFATLLPLVAIAYYPDFGLTRLSILSFIGAGISGTMIGRAIVYSSIEKIGASLTTPIVALWVVVATILGVILFGESLTPIHLVSIACIVVGIVIIAWETSHENPTSLSGRDLTIGLLIPFSGAFIFGMEPIFATVGLEQGTPAPVGLVIKTVAAILGLVGYLRWKSALPSLQTIGSANSRWFLLAGIANTIFLLGYYGGLSIAPVSIITPIIITNTMFVVVLSALFMPSHLERVSWRLIVATAIVVVGIGGITIAG